MKPRFYWIIISLFAGAFVSAISISFAMAWLTTPDTVLVRIGLWNLYAAKYLVERGLLPLCWNCGLLSLFFVLFDGFLVGVIGYSVIAWPFFLVIRRNRS